jgi:hypothetical protein
MSHICGVSKTFGEWYQKTNKTEDTNKLTLLALKIIIILHNTRLVTFIKLLKTVSKGLFRSRSQNSRHTLLDCRPFTEHFRHTTYLELLVKPEMLTSYIYISYPVAQLCVSTLLDSKVSLITDGIYFSTIRVKKSFKIP